MNIKKLAITIGIILMGAMIAILFVFRDIRIAQINAADVNDITQSIAERWEGITKKGSDRAELPCLQYGFDYVILDRDDNFIAATRRGLNETIRSAISNRDIIVDIELNDEVLGKLILYNNASEIWKQYRSYLLVLSLSVITFIAVLCVIYALFIDRRVLKPFRRLKGFARHVAGGRLDMPLEMDKGRLFGAFSESFDLMREELKKARDNERLANQSKKELVASLSHDIKTPVASIKAISEVISAKSDDESLKKQLDIINSKADQINILITNMFNATLEELQELKVEATEQPSTILYNLIKNADYNQSVNIPSIPECIVVADELRLAQVVDNVISNSYKYAGTPIDVSARIKGNFLELTFRDVGPGVADDERLLLFNKFYRAGNSEGKSGSGLGLYISKYLMDRMSGDIACTNTGSGFAVTLKLLIA